MQIFDSDQKTGNRSGSERLYPAPGRGVESSNGNAPAATGQGRYKILERETGFEPATLSLGS